MQSRSAPDQRAERQLVAVVAADIAGYSFPSGVGHPFMTRRDERRFDHRMRRGEGLCPQTRLWAQTSDGDTERGRSL
jgi:hypothetical protein